MADDRRRTNLLQDAFDQIARLTGVSLSENRPANPSSSAPASNSVSMELSRRFPSLRMPAAATGSAASLAGGHSKKKLHPPVDEVIDFIPLRKGFCEHPVRISPICSQPPWKFPIFLNPRGNTC